MDVPAEDQLRIATDLLFQTTQVMIPVLTGYIVLLGALTGKLHQAGTLPCVYKVLVATFIFAALSLLFWTFVLPFCYKVALGIDQAVWAGLVGGEWKETLGVVEPFCKDAPGDLWSPCQIFQLARKFAFVAQVSFIISIVLGGYTALRAKPA